MKKNSVNPHLYKARTGNCLICNKEYRAITDYGDRKQKYCSKECYAQSGKLINYCLTCNNSIVTYKSQNKKYCNSECRNIDYRNRFTGENSHLWEGGKTKKSKLLKAGYQYKEWRMSVFKRDGFKCIHCGSNENIEADHIKAQSQYPDLIYDVNNGRTLCHECHKNTDNYGYKQAIIMKKAVLQEC